MGEGLLVGNRDMGGDNRQKDIFGEVKHREKEREQT